MENLTRFALERWRLTVLFVGLVVGLGSLTYLDQPSQEDPEIVIRTAVVSAALPGLSAPRVEQLLVEPIEEAVKQIPEVEKVRASAEYGVATLKVDLLPTVSDVKRVWSDLRNKLADLAPELPQGTVGPIVNDDYGRVAVTTLALSGRDFSHAELRAEARWLRDRLSALPKVSRVDLYGAQDERIWLTFERARLAQIGLSPQAVLTAIAEQNRILPSGALLTDDGMRYTLEPSGDFRSVEAIGDVPVRTPSGTVVYVRDLFDLERGYVDPPRRPVLFDGRPAVVVAISMVPNVSIQAFGTEIDAAVSQLRGELPVGMSLELATHQPPIVARSVAEASSNLAQTLATVLVVVMLFLGFRAGAIVGTIVPLSIFLALVGMRIREIPLHRVSIAAVIIALGLLVDSGVVVTEDIKKRIDEGAARLDAALATSRSLAIPLLTSSLTTVLAFLPLMLAPDATGEFLRALAEVIAITILSSWLLSITVTPLLCVRFLVTGSTDARGERRRRFALADAYERVLAGLLRRRAWFLVAMALLFILALVGLSRVPSGLLPPSERAQFVLKIELPAGASEIETSRVAERVSRWLADDAVNPEVVSNVLYVASGGPRFFLALSPLDPAPHIAFGVVNTARADDVERVRTRLGGFLAAQVPEGRGWTELLFLGQEPPGTLEIRLAGDDLQVLHRTALRIEDLFVAIPGTRNVRDDWGNPVLQLDVLIDQERSRRASLAPDAIARALETSLDGVRITDYREGDRIIPVMLRARQQDRANLDDVAAVTVVSDDGTPVPLVQVAELAGELTPYSIRRRDLERTITVSGANSSLSAGELLARLAPRLDALDLPAGFHWSAGGEVEASARANAALLRFMPECFLAILVLLVWQFDSFRRVAIILLTIPLLLIGATAGLMLFSATLDFNGLLGMLALAGIIVNNAIVLIERIDEERRAGARTAVALCAAGRERLRPILMTSLTTIVGLVPLCLLGGELWFSMTIVLMFGLGVGTLLTLGVVPALYAAMFREANGA